MDCEGGEWELLEDKEAWKHIRAFTMEYHLWARPGSSWSSVVATMEDMGFTIINHSPLSDTFGLLTGVRNDR
jgi:hypothetical protein